MFEHRLIFERFTRKAFGVKTRKALYCADADFFDLAAPEAIIAVMAIALFTQRDRQPGHREWIEKAIHRLETINAGFAEICSILEELPNELQ